MISLKAKAVELQDQNLYNNIKISNNNASTTF